MPGSQFAVKTFSRIDILVRNAGIQTVSLIEDFAFADWKRLLSIHLDGALVLQRRFGRAGCAETLVPTA